MNNLPLEKVKPLLEFLRSVLQKKFLLLRIFFERKVIDNLTHKFPSIGFK